MELLGGESDEDDWLEAVLLDDEDSDGDAESSGGLWLRQIDPETTLAYHMNDETGVARRNLHEHPQQTRTRNLP